MKKNPPYILGFESYWTSVPLRQDPDLGFETDHFEMFQNRGYFAIIPFTRIEENVRIGDQMKTKQYKVKIERSYYRGTQQDTSREIVGDLEYIKQYFGAVGKTIKGVLKNVNKEYDRRYAACYSGCTATLVEAI